MKSLKDLNGQRIYLDSNVLIYAVETAAAAQTPLTHALLREVSIGRIKAHASQIVRAEVMVHPLRSGNQRLADIYSAMLATSGPIAMISIDAAVADLAASLRASQRSLKLADALHLAAALTGACRTFISADRALKSALAHILPARMEVLSLQDISV